MNRPKRASVRAVIVLKDGVVCEQLGPGIYLDPFEQLHFYAEEFLAANGIPPSEGMIAMAEQAVEEVLKQLYPNRSLPIERV